jgi:long-subunit fatty acid transport protein
LLLKTIGEVFGELLANPEVDAIQSSSGITPIAGLNFNWHDRWYIGLKYEHRTYINLVTKINNGKDGAGLYVEGKRVRADLPGFLSSGLAFRPNERLTIAAGNRLFFNKRTNLNGREQYIKSLYKEFSLSAEYKLFPRFTVSGGITYRTSRYEDEYYTDVDYFLPAYTFAGGFKSDISRRISVEAGFLTSLYTERTYYKDYELFGGQLALLGLDLPAPLNDALKQKIRYDVDGKAFVVSVGVTFWMGSMEQNQRDRTRRVNELREKRRENRELKNEDISQ